MVVLTWWGLGSLGVDNDRVFTAIQAVHTSTESTGPTAQSHSLVELSKAFALVGHHSSQRAVGMLLHACVFAHGSADSVQRPCVDIDEGDDENHGYGDDGVAQTCLQGDIILELHVRVYSGAKLQQSADLGL